MTATHSQPAIGLRGLTTEQAARLRDRHGRNELPEPKPRRLRSRIGAQLRDPLVLVLLAAMAVTAALRDVPDLVVIGMVVLLNTTVGVTQEVRADRAVAALRRLAAPDARVRRDGRDVRLPAAELVPGDLVRVGAGDVVPADVALVEAARLSVDEAALTGESVPVVKSPDGELFAATVVTTGAAPARSSTPGGTARSAASPRWWPSSRTGPPRCSAAFTVLGLAQLGVALALRARSRPRNWSLDAAVALSLVLQLGAVLFSPLHVLLGRSRLSLVEIGGCAAVALVPAAVTVLTTPAGRSRGLRRAPSRNDVPSS